MAFTSLMFNTTSMIARGARAASSPFAQLMRTGGGGAAAAAGGSANVLQHSASGAAATTQVSGVRMTSSSSSTPATAYDVGDSTNIKWHEGRVDRQKREAALGQKGVVLWLTGLSGSGKSTLAFTLEHALHSKGKTSYVLDGDNVRISILR